KLMSVEFRWSVTKAVRLTSVLVCLICFTSVANAEDWLQFRGPGGSGVSASKSKLPKELGPKEQVLWKVDVPTGHSSPVVTKDRIFLTAVRDKQLLTMGLDRLSGKVLWEAVAPYDTLEKIHRTGSFAQSTPATDGDMVVSFFGSSGLHAYDRNGKPLWSHRMGPFKNDFGAGSSPIIVGDSVILVGDHDIDSFIASYDKRTGKLKWKTDRSEFFRNYATPVVWEVNGKKEIVVSATLRIVGYDFETGQEKWTVTGVARIINMTPVIGPDNTLYAACFSPGAEGDDRVVPQSVDDLFASDTDKNGTIEESEFPDNPLKKRFSQIDRNKDEHITREEYKAVSRALSEGRNVVLAVKPGGTGDITKTHVKWEYTQQIPYCPSPLLYNGVLFMVKDGGILTTLDATTGKLIKRGRLTSTGGFYASPVVGDGKLYLMSQEGDLSVVSAEGQWEELSSAKFEADGHGTPAIVNGRIYARLGGQLYCFGLPDQTASLRK
ncbi:MAG: pyrrolo-quinoline quinone, partial [Planctomycetaceae bacterium]|nr:pyrrolo-quinoline quinone [Planctomycetaceae bacterium]